MELTLEAEGGQTASVDMTIETEAEMLALVDLVGANALFLLGAGEWDEKTGRAILYVKTKPPCSFDDFWVEWPDDLNTPRKDIEEQLPVEAI